MFYSKNLKKILEIKHCFFSKKNGKSKGIYKSLNCGIGSNDKKSNVNQNLRIVSKKFNIDVKYLTLMNQTHSNKVKIIKKLNGQKKLNCDAILTKSNKLALSVLTADCVPILIYEKRRKIIGCIHAGWKGAISGIIENTLKKLRSMGGKKENLLVSIGPCISKKNYEVKKDFYYEFVKKSKNNTYFFSRKNKDLFNFDLRGFVNKKFIEAGVTQIENIYLDSFAAKNEYFSHRRAKKLGQDDYGRCISVIKRISLQN